MRYPCYALDVTQSFEEKALLCTNLCAQAFSTPHQASCFQAVGELRIQLPPPNRRNPSNIPTTLSATPPGFPIGSHQGAGSIGPISTLPQREGQGWEGLLVCEPVAQAQGLRTSKPWGVWGERENRVLARQWLGYWLGFIGATFRR
jgi:hypothetical protein